MTKIGVFDSGIGGLAVAKAIQRALPDAEVLYANDRQHVPYGDKTPDQLLGFVVPILEDLVQQGCTLLVIACNTATTVLRDNLRSHFKIPIIGIEPMVKPAAEQSETGVIAVCATPGTLASKRYKWLKQTYAKGIRVIEPDCSDWAYMIENNQVNHRKIEQQIITVCEAGADVIVLGCTHYHWIEEAITEYTAGRAVVVQPEQAIVRQLLRVIEEKIET